MVKKVYLVAKGDLSHLSMVCEEKSDAEGLVDMWGKDYLIFEVPYLAGLRKTSFPPYDGIPKSKSVEPMPFIGKPPVIEVG